MSDAEQNTVDNVGRGGPRTRQRLSALLIGTALVVIALAASIAIAIPVVFAIPDIESLSFLLASLIVTEVAFLTGGLVYILWRLGRNAITFRIPTRSEFVWIAGGFIVALAIAFGSIIVSRFLGIEATTSVLDPSIVADPAVLLVLAGLSVILVAPAEELLFRGAIQTRLGHAYGPILTVGLSSLLFASIHVLNFVSGTSGVLFATATIFAVGLVLGAVYERTKNLAVPVLVHGSTARLSSASPISH